MSKCAIARRPSWGSCAVPAVFDYGDDAKRAGYVNPALGSIGDYPRHGGMRPAGCGMLERILVDALGVQKVATDWQHDDEVDDSRRVGLVPRSAV